MEQSPQLVEQLQGQLKMALGQIEDMRKAHEKLKEKVHEMETKNSGGKNDQVLTNKELHTPDKFAGERSEYREWAQDLAEHLSWKVKKIEEVVKWVNKQDEPISADDFNDWAVGVVDDPAKFNADMHRVLKNFTKR